MKKGEDYTGITICFFCHDGNGRFIMAQRSKNCRDEHGRWDIGAGGLDYGDMVEDTLRKEILEEYCTDVIEYKFLGFRELHREHEGKPTHWISLDFKVLVDPEKVKNGEPYKFDKVEWFTFDTLPSPTHSQFPAFVEKHKEHLP